MADDVFCPHCGAAFVSADQTVKIVVTCQNCGKRYYPSAVRPHKPRPAPVPREALPAIPGYNPGAPARNGRRERRRTPLWASERDEQSNERVQRLREAIRTPAVLLLVSWALGALVGSVFVTVALFSLFAGGKGNPDLKQERRIIIAVGAAYGIGVPVGFYGAVRMYRGTSYGWSTASAVLLLVGFPGCLLSWLASIWALVVLHRSDVRRLFDPYGDDDPDDPEVERARRRHGAPKPAPAPEEPEWLDEAEPAPQKPDTPPDHGPPASPPAPSHP